MGLCNKTLIVVPNHLTEQMASEALLLYPNAEILVARKTDFEKANRKNSAPALLLAILTSL